MSATPAVQTATPPPAAEPVTDPPAAAQARPVIEARGLTRRFGSVEAVKDLDLTVREGELYGFLGTNGAGKTTTMRMLCGLLRPTKGEIRIDGKSYADKSREIRKLIGYVPDTPPLYEYLTGRQYIGFVASLYGIPTRARDDEGDRLLELFGLADRADQLCKGYSHGMKKKLHIAAVLVTRPKVLLMDEPTTGLDPRSARTLQDTLRRFCDEGATILLSTHLLHTAENICDRVGIIDRGSFRAEGTMDDLRGIGRQESLEDIFLRLTEEAAEEQADADEIAPQG